MTITAHKVYKQIGTEEKQEHMALAICTLLFVGLISGILFIVATVFFVDAKDKQNTVKQQDIIIE